MCSVIDINVTKLLIVSRHYSINILLGSEGYFPHYKEAAQLSMQRTASATSSHLVQRAKIVVNLLPSNSVTTFSSCGNVAASLTLGANEVQTAGRASHVKSKSNDRDQTNMGHSVPEMKMGLCNASTTRKRQSCKSIEDNSKLMRSGRGQPRVENRGKYPFVA